MRKLYLKLVLAIWAVMIISSAGAVAVIKIAAPGEPRGSQESDRLLPQSLVEHAMPTLVDRAVRESRGRGAAGLVEWFEGDILFRLRATYLLRDGTGKTLLQEGRSELLAESMAADPELPAETRKIEFELDGLPYELVVYLPDLTEPSIRRPGPWQRAVALFAFRPGTVWLKLLIAIPLSVFLSTLIAKYLVMPLRWFEHAGKQLAEGDLSVRIASSLGKRGDEIADFAGTFDQMAAQIETLVQSHKELLRDVSHELRSPLARVHAALSLARQRTSGTVDAELDRIELEIDRLNGLIGKLLTFARLDTRQSGVKKVRLDVGDILADAIEDADIEARTDKKQIELSQTSELEVIGDPYLLASCFENIIRNAVHHAPRMTNIEVCANRTAGNPGHCEVTVRDYGAGVADDDLGSIFDPFVKFDQADSGASDGAGIGLAIAKKVVSLHNGEISARNASGGGLVVSVRLPLAAQGHPS